MNYRIFPPEEMIDTTVTLPLSKSVTNRELIINALTEGSRPIPPHLISESEDSEALCRCLKAISASEPGSRISLDVKAGGTTFRFVTALCSAIPGLDVDIDGTPRLRQRPVAELVEALRQLGADIQYLAEEGHAPLRVKGKRLSGGRLEMNPRISSQFISALMMIAPTMQSPLTLDFNGEEPVSKSYIKMTALQMERAGVEVEINPTSVTVPCTTYRPVEPYAERDWSAASYWYAISAVSAGFVTLSDLSTESLQGDSAVARLFERLGVVTAQSDETDNAIQLTPDPEQFSRFEEDLSATPDIAQTIAVTAALLGIPFHLRGLSTLRHKETDRLEAMRVELDRFGIIAEIRNDSEIVWNGERHPIFEIPQIDTYEDHRMAMSFAPAAIFIPGLVINDVEVVDKSYPGFWDDLRNAGFTLTDASVPLPDNEEDEE